MNPSAIAGPATSPQLILHGGKIAMQDERRSFATAVAITNGKFSAVGSDREVLASKGAQTQVIDLQGKTVIPGLNDSHLHVIRGGLNFNLELRWDGVPSLSDALTMLKDQAARTPAPQWVRVVGGWSEFQFQERRMPTLEEINAAAPDTPVFILHLYDSALLNRAALRAVGYTKDTPDPVGGIIVRDKQGNPTGALIAKPNAMILYKTLAMGPKLELQDQINSTRHFMRELNRLGLTSVIDAGGGFQNYPDDYQVIEELHQRGQLTVRIAYNLFTQNANKELNDFSKWVEITKPGAGDDFYRMNGAGEMLVFSAADFEDFLEPRPDLSENLEAQLTDVVRLLAEKRWPFRLHATYNESISRFLDVFEKVDREIPFNGLNWFFDHAETITSRNIERVRALGGGIAVQHRMAFQGEYFIQQYGKEAAEHSPPIAEMLRAGIPVGAGTDGTRVATYNPWVSLYWLVSGKTLGGTQLYTDKNRLERMEALRLYTVGSSWFSSECGKKGAIAEGQLADLAVLSDDFFTVPELAIKSITSVLTVVGGKIVYAAAPFDGHRPPDLPVSPDWSPVKKFGGHYVPQQNANRTAAPVATAQSYRPLTLQWDPGQVIGKLLWGHGCDCFAF